MLKVVVDHTGETPTGVEAKGNGFDLLAEAQMIVELLYSSFEDCFGGMGEDFRGLITDDRFWTIVKKHIQSRANDKKGESNESDVKEDETV